MIYRPNGARRTRHYVRVPVSWETLELANGWALFQVLVTEGQRHRFDPGRLEYRNHATTPTGITALFEVV